MSDEAVIESMRMYRETLDAVKQLYAECGAILDAHEGGLANRNTSASFAAQMNELHNGLIMKVFAWIARNPTQSVEQRQLARVLLTHLWNQPVMGTELREAIQWLLDASSGFQWDALVQPFLKVPELRDHYGELMSLVMRMGNLIARADGTFSPDETERLASLQSVMDAMADGMVLPPKLSEPPESSVSAKSAHSKSDPSSPKQTPRSTPDPKSMSEALRWLRSEAERLRDSASPANLEPTPLPSPSPQHSPQPTTPPNQDEPQDARSPEERLADARNKLDSLIGLQNIKQQIETLTNFLKMERLRIAEGLPTTEPSLHMSFVGNPGTGKTTVARIVAEIYGALGILKKGHLVETDRSGLVAEYAGQTGPKTNAKIDEALDGVLFIDEAYTLIDSNGQDQYGREAIQTLLKRMEDQRDRLVVILAGYPVEMQMMIRSNPGLSSRVGTTLHFEDYTPGEMARIFGLMAGKAKYTLPTESRRRLLYGFDYLHDRRDRHFGNGRTVRNSFERSVRRLANRLAGLTQVDRDLLTTLEQEDIEVDGIEQAHLAALASQSGYILVHCNHCEKEVTIADSQLANEMACPSCQQEFLPGWGELVSLAQPTPTNEPASNSSDPSESASS